MEKMDIRSHNGIYSVYFVENPDYSAILRDGDIVIIDRKVFQLYEQELSPFFSEKNHILIDATEEQKSYEGAGSVIHEIIERGFHKNNRLIAIGGGIVQDVTAFIASILYRGVEWILVPTTLLAQCDSCIGSKTSINFSAYKNQIGGFYPPKNIYIDTNFLRTLSDKEMKSGLGEMLHYYVVGGEEDFHFYAEHYQSSMDDMELLKKLVMRSLEIKKSYVEIDEFDRKERQIFNYGHTFGHALESITHYAVPHGIAVSYGMDLANALSVKRGILEEHIREEIRNVTRSFWSDAYIRDFRIEPYLAALSKDKKNEGKKVGAILCSGFGRLSKEMLEMDEDLISFLDAFFRNDAKTE